MRISVDPDSKYWSTKAYRVDVFCDGKKLERCLEFDDKAGWAVVRVVDDVGRPVPIGDSAWAEKKLKGVITWQQR